MKKNNKEGFILAEAIVVGVFLIGLLSVLITNVLPLVGEYERSFNYDQIDRKYDVNLIRKMILMEDGLNFDSDLTNNYHQYSKDAFCAKFTSLNDYNDYCLRLLGDSMLDIKNIVISTYDITSLKASTELSRGLKEYVKYLPTDSNHDSKYNNYKKIIVEFNDQTFASIEVPYE